MKALLMSSLFALISSEVEISIRYTPQTLPRDQWYEVMSYSTSPLREKFCLNQYLHPYYSQSRFVLVKRKAQQNCLGGEDFLQKQQGEIRKIIKTEQGLKLLFLDGSHSEKKEWKIPLWNFQSNRSVIVFDNQEQILFPRDPRTQQGYFLNDCGARDQRACPQGILPEDERINLVCPLQRNGALCQKGLVAFCFENHVYCK